MRTIQCLLAAVALFASSNALARIISYNPITDRHATPAVQSRTNRYYLLIESGQAVATLLGAQSQSRPGELVLYDSRNEHEPRPLSLPSTAGRVLVVDAAVRESSSGEIVILVGTIESPPNSPINEPFIRISTDAGKTWKRVAVGNQSIAAGFAYEDVGGRFVRDRGTQIEIGTEEWPFIIATALTPTAGSREIHAISRAGDSKLLVRDSGGAGPGLQLAGSDRAGGEVLVVGGTSTPSRAMQRVKVDGNSAKVADLAPSDLVFGGWIGEDGAVYTDEVSGGRRAFARYANGSRTAIANGIFSWDAARRMTLFAVPSHDYRSAWVVQRSTGAPTTLSRYDGVQLQEQWRDISGPQVEAIHAAASGQRLLIQVHRPRTAMTQQILVDPALAIWEIGSPAPSRYDELFLIEGPMKGFVHLDVDAVASGSSFIFDSAAVTACNCGGGQISAGGGGYDVTQEWGTVRASLRQRLIIPGVARLAGAYGSNWRSDVILQNADTQPLPLQLRLSLRNGNVMTVDTALRAKELRHVPDVLASLFGVTDGGGTLELVPPVGRSVNATVRTYNVTPAGTYGMGFGAIDANAGASARFPLSFAGAFPGMNFRTNLIVTDSGERGTNAFLEAQGSYGKLGKPDVTLDLRPRGEMQMNDIAQTMAVPPWEFASLLFRPTRGEAIPALVVIDNLTNDPTYFPPDIPANVPRMIPVIGHVDGANGSRFRSDLYLFNPSYQVRTVMLNALAHDGPAQRGFTYTMLPRESKVIRDVLQTAFGMTGLARLNFVSGNLLEASSVRVTSRTYNVDANGGTYGFVMPPLNAFQTVGPGESIEVLGATADPNFRVNLGIADISGGTGGRANMVKVDIIGDGGKLLSSFEIGVPSAGSIQILDVLRGRAIPQDGAPVLFRLSPTGGLIGAFPTLIDNRTNDAVLLTSGLAAKD